MARTIERSGALDVVSRPDALLHDTWASRIVLSLVLLLLVSVLSFFPVVRDVELRITDTFFRLMPHPTERSAVVLVLIDDESLRQYGRWPWSREILGTLVSKITKAGAGVIGLDVLLSEPQSPATDGALEQSLKASARTVIVGKIGAFTDGPHWVEPLPQFSASSIAVGHVHAALDEDGICRRFPPLELTIDGPRWAFALEVARRSDPRRASQFLEYYGLPSDDNDAHVLSARPLLARVYFRHDGFDTVSAATLLRDAELPIKLAGRPVLIGFGSAELTDRLNTPIATEMPSPGVEVHAQILDGILNGHLIKDVPVAVNVLLLALTCFLVVILFRKWHGRASVLLFVALAIVVYAAAFLTFLWTLRIFSVGPMLLTVVLGPLVVYAADFTLVERSLMRQLHALRAWLAIQGQDVTSAKSGLSWKLSLLQKLETELGALYELHQTLLESTQDLVAIFDEKGQLLLKNRSLAAALRNDESVLTLDQLCAKWTAEPDAPLLHVGGAQEGEVHLNGALYSARLAPLPPTNLSPGGGTLVTLTSLQTRVERDRARGEVLAFITHELRTPLASIQGFADLMVRYPGSPGCVDAPETILRESKRLLALINSYLDVLRLDAGAKPLQQNMFDLTNTVREVFEILRPLAADVDMRLVLKTDAATVATGDANLISGAVLNLVSNAIKYGKRGADIEVTCAAPAQEVVIGVRNQGKVISVADIPHLFDPYYRARDVDKAKPGWGLGLAFVKRIAEKHGGSVQVRSEPSSTVFEIHLPVESAPAVPSEVRI
jgi:signal transduction histidine kinase